MASKTLALTHNFNDAGLPIGKLELSTAAIELLAQAPDHAIVFGYYKNPDDTWEVISAALVPTANVMREPIAEAYAKRVGGDHE